MIDYETYCQIRLLAEKGLKASQIAAELQLDIKTVEKWMERESFQQRQSPKRSSKLDAFKNQIITLLGRHPYTAQQILQQLQQQGYAGGYTILKDYVRRVRPVRKAAYLMLEFAAGECAQVDWGQYGSVPVGSTRRRLSFFLMVLCLSRMLYLEFTLSEAMDQFLTCHRYAFEFFGGVPEKIMIDNLKVGVVRHPAGQKALFNPRYLDFAAHYGFQPVACNIRKGNEKGRVENGVGYVKKNFLNGLEIPSFAALNPAAIQWGDTIANVRIHGETNQKPLALFEKEKPLLKALPVMPYDCAVIEPADVSRCCHIIFQSNRYSVPYLYASQRLTLKILPEHSCSFITKNSWRRMFAVTSAASASPIPTTSRNFRPSVSNLEIKLCSWPFSTFAPKRKLTAANSRKNGPRAGRPGVPGANARIDVSGADAWNKQ